MNLRNAMVAGCAPALMGAAIVAAFAVSLLLPPGMTLALMSEGGPIESATALLYLVAVAAVWAVGNPVFCVADALASSMVLVAGISREISLRRLLIDRWGIDSACCALGPYTVDARVLLLLPVVCAGAWLLARYSAALWRALRGRAPAAMTLAVLAFDAIISQLMDGLPALAGRAGYALTPGMGVAALSLEETLELMLPVLVIVAVFQVRFNWRERDRQERA